VTATHQVSIASRKEISNVPDGSADDTVIGNPETSDPAVSVKDTLIWDRKSEGGFPETKELKNRVRNLIEPDRDLGHIDRSLKGKIALAGTEDADTVNAKGMASESPGHAATNTSNDCADCR